MRTQKDYIEELRQQGFKTIEIINDAPGTVHPNHAHPTLTGYVILDGELNLDLQGVSHILRPGERFEISRETQHSTRTGLIGCQYLRASH
jgi:quercetin dioxygenase-like cupin family protein